MRFEQIGRTPLRWVELDLDDATLTVREGFGSDHTTSTQTFERAEDAQGVLHTREISLRAAGFVRINRLASAAPEEPLKRAQRFEWADGETRRFREIQQRDEAVRVVDGELDGDSERRDEPETTNGYNTKGGTAIFGREVERTQREIADAERRARRLAEKHAVRARGRAPATHVHAELEAECRASPDSPAPWQVYADWLLEHGNPIGEIAALAIGGDLRAAIFAAQDHFVELDSSNDAFITLELTFGFIRRVRVKSSKPGALAAQIAGLLVSPACRFVDDLALESSGVIDRQWPDTMAAVADAPLAATLRSLALDAAEDEERQYLDYGDLLFAWPKLPALEHLHIRGGSVSLGVLPPVRTYIRETDDLSGREVTSLLDGTHRRLANLVLGTGKAWDGCDLALDDLAPLLAARGVPALRHLGILDSELTDGLIARLATSKLLPQLHSLDLSNGNAGEVAAAALVEHAPRFRHLASLDLSGNFIDYTDEHHVRGALDNVITNAQRDRDGDY